MSATGRTRADGSVYVRDSRDFFGTPSWCVDAILREIPIKAGYSVLDPGCGTGNIIRRVRDVYPDGLDLTLVGCEKDPELAAEAQKLADIQVLEGDYLSMNFDRVYDVCIANPPFKLAQEFVEKAFSDAHIVVMLLRLNWLEGQKRAP